MSIPNVPLTIPPLPSFPSLFTQPSSFSTGEQSTLQKIADALAGFSQSIITTGAQDLFNTEQTLQSNNTTLNTVISNLVPVLPTLTNPSFVSNLSSILSNPSVFISSNLPSGLTTINSAFNQYGILTNNIVSPPALFPLSVGSTSSQFVQSLLTFAIQPSNVIATLLVPPQTSSFPGSVPNAIWYTLSNESGGPTGSAAQTALRPLVNVLFGASPAVSSSTDPFDILFSLVSSPSNFFLSFLPGNLSNFSSGPAGFIKGLFSSSILFNGISGQQLIGDLLYGSNFAKDFSNLFSQNPVNGITAAQIISDMFFADQNVPNDILTFVSGKFPSWFVGLFPSTNGIQNANSSQQIMNDLLGNPGYVPLDILNMTNLSNLGVNFPIGKLFGNYLTGLLNNFSNLTQNIFTGSPGGTSQIGVSISAMGGSSYTGDFVNWNGSAYVPSIAPKGLSLPSAPGWIGLLLAEVTASAGGMAYLVDSGILNNAAANFNVGAIVNVIEHAILDNVMLARALITLTQIVGQIVSTVMNIGNVLGQSGIPQTPPGFIGMFPYLNITPSSWYNLF